jgi:hypothetical protein
LILNKIGPIIITKIQSKIKDSTVPDSILRIIETSISRDKISPVLQESKKDRGN